MKNNTIPTIQVLLCTSNSLKYINEQINTLLSQTNVNVSILCSDDFSTDGTFEYLQKLSNENSKIKLLPRVKKFGFAGGNFYNLIFHADYENFDYIALADHDDIWLNNKLESAIKIMNLNHYYAYSSSFVAFWSNNKMSYVDKTGSQTSYDYLFSSPGPGCTFVLVSKILKDFKIYLSIHQDGLNVFHHDWIIYAWLRSVYPDKWFIDKCSYLMYRQHQNNETGVNSGLLAITRRVRKIRTRWYEEEVLKISRFLRDTPGFVFVKEMKSINKIGLIFKIFKLRRKRLESVFTYILILLGYIKFR